MKTQHRIAFPCVCGNCGRALLFSLLACLLLTSCIKGKEDAPLVMPDTLSVVLENRQVHFNKLPAGNYSGIAALNDEDYVLVDDMNPYDGFRRIRLAFDEKGRITALEDGGYVKTADTVNIRDNEGICYDGNNLFLAREVGNTIQEYTLQGNATGRYLPTEGIFPPNGNWGIEGLSYNNVTRRYWATTECTLASDGPVPSPGNPVSCRLRLQCYDNNLAPCGQWFYETDTPTASSAGASYTFGISELCALDDGRVLVLEREVMVPSGYVGSFAKCKIYVVNPAAMEQGCTLSKWLLTQWETSISRLIDNSLADYEGMCLGPRLKNGGRVLLLVADAQASGGSAYLKDWLKTFVLSGI